MESATPPPPPVPTPPPAAPTPAPTPPRRGWWSRNWIWFVPTGCLTLIAFFVGFILLICLAVFGAMKSSDAYKQAVARAKSDSRVVEAIGQPIKEGMFVSGNTNVEGGSGKSDLTIPIHGPKGAAKIHAVATKSGGQWEYSNLTVEVEKTGETIDLNQSDGE